MGREEVGGDRALGIFRCGAAEVAKYPDGLGLGPCSAVLSLRLMGFSAGGGGGPWLSSPSENKSSGEGERCLLGARGVVEEEGV